MRHIHKKIAHNILCVISMSLRETTLFSSSGFALECELPESNCSSFMLHSLSAHAVTDAFVVSVQVQIHAPYTLYSRKTV